MNDDRAVFACPCCGYLGLSDTYEICEFCAWEFDPVQSEYPDMLGANRVTLREAQKNFVIIGASEKLLLDMVTSPNEDAVKDPNWHPLEPLP